MKILIEDYKYDSIEIKEFLHKIDSHYNKGIVPFVGYYYSRELDDCVFFLPKVVLDSGGKVLGKYTPENLWDSNCYSEDKQFLEFLYKFPIYTYQAVNIYNRRKANVIVRKNTISNPDASSKEVQSTYLDKIIALIQFAKENKNYLLFKMQTIHSGKRKVNWPKTISRQQPILKKGKAPIYLNPIAKNKEIDYEEELLVIYFSVLRYIKDKYKFAVDINLNFNLISDAHFDSYLKGDGVKRLREIRYKYFSDRTLKIWWLCYAFFEEREKSIHSSKPLNDYLFANKFNIIFEAMVDDLIAQPKNLPPHIKVDEQEDGKIVDHLFKYKSIMDDKQFAYYIADSKYYKTVNGKDKEEDSDRGNKINGDSLFKQFTYARNLIQERLRNPQEEQRNPDYSVCRDDKTEGYNIIPNFFLSAYIEQDEQDKLDYDRDGIEPREEQNDRAFHFPNRLFDRETLLVSHYDINFLYVIKQYANNGNKDEFREKVHKNFRDNILKRLNGDPDQRKEGEYLFSVIELKQKPEQGKEQTALNEALDPIFRLVNGKLFCPKKDASYTNLILALENPERHFTASKKELENENLNVLAALEKDFIIHEGFKIGDSVEDFLMKKKTAE